MSQASEANPAGTSAQRQDATERQEAWERAEKAQVSGNLPPLGFEPGDSANLACVIKNPRHDDPNLQHTLVILPDEDNYETDQNVGLTIISNGQPDADITVSRRELLAALGVKV